MSKRIEEIIEVIKYVRDNFRKQTGHSDIRSLRISAVKSIALRRGIQETTVSNKFVRELH